MSKRTFDDSSDSEPTPKRTKINPDSQQRLSTFSKEVDKSTVKYNYEANFPMIMNLLHERKTAREMVNRLPDYIRIGDPDGVTKAITKLRNWVSTNLAK